ncbi:MAG TPA: hypothetical protein VFC19_52890 [Candidatus Limnocylindrales bacterium]|nr:hypothetical protein [Candidatus Limnocylindrales bacterium]
MSILGQHASGTAHGTPEVDELNLGYARQIRAARVLGDLLAETGAAHLPLVAWRMTVTGVLWADCLGASHEQLRASFDAWANFLAAQRLPATHGVCGSLIWRARAEDWRGCRVVVSAELLLPLDGADQ